MYTSMKKAARIRDKLVQLENVCRQAGLKLTHQRLEIFRELAMADDHPSAETIHNRLQQKLPTLSVDTVYRTLATFEKHEIITRVQTRESQARFEATMEKHHHVICKKCGTITDFTWQSFDNNQVPEEISEWGRIDGKSATLRGICKSCAEPGLSG